MKLFKDSQLVKEINTIDFDIVEVGTTKEVIIYLYNETSAYIRNLEYELHYFRLDPKGELVEVINPIQKVVLFNPPKTIQPYSTEALRLRWSPNIEYKEPLKASIKIEGEEVYK